MCAGLHLREAGIPISPKPVSGESKGFLSRKELEIPEGSWLGGIVPHAGWYFSGAIACQVIHTLKTGTPPDLFILFGMHLHPISPSYIMTEGTWETPFGELAIETELALTPGGKISVPCRNGQESYQGQHHRTAAAFHKVFFSESQDRSHRRAAHRESAGDRQICCGNIVRPRHDDQNYRIH